MGKPRANFKLNKKKNVKHVQKQKYDYSKVKGRIVGQLPDGEPIVGSESMLVLPWEHCAYFKRMTDLHNFYVEERNKFKEVMDTSPHNSVWGNETERELNHLLVNYTSI